MKMILSFLFIIGSVSAFACNVNGFVNSERGQQVLSEMDHEFRLELEEFLVNKGMDKEDFSVDTRLPNSFVSINPNGQYQWSHLKVHFPKGLRAEQGGILLSKKTKRKLDAFNRTVESKCGVEISFEGGLLFSRKWNKTVREVKLLMSLPSVSKFIELE